MSNPGFTRYHTAGEINMRRFAMFATIALFATVTAAEEGTSSFLGFKKGQAFVIASELQPSTAGKPDVTVRVAGLAGLRPVAPGLLLRVHGSIGTANPDGPVGEFMFGQIGAALVKPILGGHMSLVGGGAVTVIDPPSGREWLPSAFGSVVVRLHKTGRHDLQLLLPVIHHKKGTSIGAGIGFTF